MTISQQVRAQDIITLNEQVSAVEATAAAFGSTLDDFGIGRNEVNTDLGQIMSSLPGTVVLSSVSHGGGSMTVTGTGNDEDAVFTYAKNLRASARFSLVVIRRMDDKGNFELELTK
jgi:Tfp pilus assembly protein PilN